MSVPWRLQSPTPLGFLSVLLVVTFIAEVGVTWLMARIFPDHPFTLTEACVTALALCSMVGPAIWLLAILPAKSHALDPVVRKAVEHSDDVIFLTGPDGTFRFVNASFQRVYGYAADEVVGRVTPRILRSGSASPESYAEFWGSLTSRETVTTEFTNRTKDGALIRVQAKVTPVVAASGELTGFLAIQRDITEAKRVESALREAEDRYRGIFERAVAGVYLSTPEGRLLMVNPAMARMFGYAGPDEMLATVADVGQELYADETQRSVFRRQAESGVVEGLEFELVRRHQRRFWVSVSARAIRGADGRITCYEGIMTDITCRKEAEAALRAERDRSQQYLDVVDVILLCLDRQGEVTLLNRAGSRALGYAEGELLGRNWFDTCVPAESREDLRREFTAWLDHGQESLRRHANQVLTRAGEERTISWHNVRLTDDSGAVIGSLSSGEDITDRRLLEEQFRQAQKMEAVGLLAGGIAHDFNNMLTTILGYTQLAADALPEDSPARADLAEVQRAGEAAAELTKRLLAFGRRQMLRVEAADLNLIVSRVEKILRSLLGESIELVLDLGEDLAKVDVDAGQIDQVVLNLAANAKDAMPHGGTLAIATRPGADGCSAWLPAGADPRAFVHLSVTDTGIGMDASTLGRIFDPFFTTKPRGRGTGLGLAAVDGIVRQLGGHVHARSSPGEGTTIEIWLPRSRSAASGRSSDGTEPDAPSGSETVLIVEDEDGVRRLAAHVLSSRGYTVLQAVDGVDALRTSDEHPAAIDLVMTDIVMPRLTGPAAVQRIRRRRPRVRVLYMSGFAAADMGVGADAPFLAKPFSPDGLARAVRRVLDGGG